MKKAVWITLIVSLIVVNIAAELVGYYTRFEIIQLYRITLVLGFTVVAAIFSGAMLLISKQTITKGSIFFISILDRRMG